MRWFRFAVLTLIAAIIQTAVINSLPIRPNLLLILMLFFTIYYDTKEAIITSFVIGFAADLIYTAMGPMTISFGLIGSLLAYLNTIISIRKMLYQAIVIFIITIITAILANILLSIKTNIQTPTVFPGILAPAIYSSIIGPFLFLTIAWWMQTKNTGITK